MRDIADASSPPQAPSPRVVVAALGVAQILGWGTSFYFPGVLAAPIVADTGWSLGWVVGGVSLGLLMAGLISPRVGTIIDRRGGRPVLVASSLLHVMGLVTIGLSPNLPVYLLGWAIVGAAMGTGLYDAAFAALGRAYGNAARGPITTLTLFGGFASTVCWPLGAFLVELVGWRGTCFAYAALHLVIALPLQFYMPRGRAVESAGDRQAGSGARGKSPALPREAQVFLLLALVLSIAAGIGSIVVVHLLIFLQARGLDFATAVTLGALFGPAQVGARLVERLFGRHYHPIWTMVASGLLMAIGLVLLKVELPIAALAILLYGGGYGISWIARGTLPLALFGPQRYPVLMGRLAFPSLIVQALAPSAGALLIEAFGSGRTIAILIGFAAVNIALIGVLWTQCRAWTAP
jgi:predicted MFS family arabinose efflux permease